MPRKTEGKGVDLDELQEEAEKIVALLKDRHPGLITWNNLLLERVQNLHGLTSQALSKK